jgi:hypothetical protein
MKEDTTVTIWEILQGSLLRGSLTDAFSYLADSPGFDRILDSVMSKALSAKEVKGTLVISFPGGEMLTAGSPATKITDHFPDSFKQFLMRHKFLELKNARIILGDHGYLEADEWLDGSDWLEIVPAEKIVSPLWRYSDCWVY